jgi:hypothetical protein
VGVFILTIVVGELTGGFASGHISVATGILDTIWWALVLPYYSLAVRRVHDCGGSGWWMLLFSPLIPLCAFVLGVSRGKPGANKYGPAIGSIHTAQTTTVDLYREPMKESGQQSWGGNSSTKEVLRAPSEPAFVPLLAPTSSTPVFDDSVEPSLQTKWRDWHKVVFVISLAVIVPLMIGAALMPSNSTTTPETTITTNSQWEPDEAYLQEVDRMFQVDTVEGRHSVIAFGHEICTYFESGQTGSQVAEQVSTTVPQMTFDETWVLIHAAMTSYCPGYFQAFSH